MSSFHERIQAELYNQQVAANERKIAADEESAARLRARDFYCRTIEDQMIERFVAGESHAIACTRGDTIRNRTHKFTMESEDLLVVKEHLERVTEGYATCQLKERWRWEVTCDLKPLNPLKLSAAQPAESTEYPNPDDWEFRSYDDDIYHAY